MRHRAKRSFVVAAILAGAIACVPVLSATGKPTATYETKVRISERSPAFHGRVQSTFEPCEKRKVRLVKKSVDEKKLLGTARTDGKGEWKVPVDELTLKSGT